jgi:hypothetical protein
VAKLQKMEYKPTHLDDLESLYYCCVVWGLEGDIPWKTSTDLATMLSARKSYHGSTNRKSPQYADKWTDYVLGLHAVLFPVEGAPVCVSDVREAFIADSSLASSAPIQVHRSDRLATQT